MAGETLTYRIESIIPTEEQIARWEVLRLPDTRMPTLVGDCPICGDECEIEVSDVAPAGGAPSAGTADTSVAEMTREIICNCRINHDWPAGVRAGCGRSWGVRLTLDADGEYLLRVETDRGLLRVAAALAEAQAGQDKRIQAAAEKWLGAVTALYGLFALTGVATAKDALNGLSTGSRWWVAAALLVGVASAAVALIFGYWAAYGWPRLAVVDENNKMLHWYRDYMNYAPQAARQLRVALVSAASSLAAITALALLVWFLPRK